MEIQDREKNRDWKQTADDVLDVFSEILGTLASPSTLFLLVITNSSGMTPGFGGYVTNPPSPSALPNVPGNVISTLGVWIVESAIGHDGKTYYYLRNKNTNSGVGEFSTVQAAEDWARAHPNGP